MSALWHDVDYVPEQRFEIPLVQHGLEDMGLPTEEHQLPDGVEDPFKKKGVAAISHLDVANSQQDLGMKGATYLDRPLLGKMAPPPPDPVEVSRRVDDATLTNGSVPERKIVESVRTDLEQIRMTNQAATITVPTTKGATRTAAEKERVSGAHNASSIGDALGPVATFLPLAAGQAVQTVVQGPLPALATQALTVTSGVVGAGELIAAGVAEGLKEDEPVVVKRGLSRPPIKLKV